MTNLPNFGGLLGGGTTTPTSGGGTTPDLTSLVSSVDSGTSSPLTGGTDTGLISSAAFNPSLYEPGGLFSPTGAQSPAVPAAQEAQQDPSGQVPTEQQIDRGDKADRATTQDQPTTRSAKGDQTPAGPTGLGGDQTSDVRQSGLAKLAQALTGQQPKPTPAAAVDAAGAAQPAAAPQPQAAAAPPAAPPAEPARVGPTSSQPVPAAQPSATAGAAPAGTPPLLQMIHNALRALGGHPLEGRQQPLSDVAGQAYPQREFRPFSPTGMLGPIGRAAQALAGRRPGKYAQPSQQEWERNQSSQGWGPAPGQDGEVTAPTEQQVQQTRIMGTDTPPTAGFSPVLEQARAKFRQPLSDPRTRWETLAMMALENEGDPAGVAESFLNRLDYANTSPRNMLHSGFYGPINFGRLGAKIRQLQANPERAAKLNAGLETALRGSNLLGGATDQGSFASSNGSGRDDPNVHHTGGRVGRFGEIYNDWGGGPGGHDGAALWRKQQQKRVREGMQQADLGKQFAMDIGRRVPFTGGAEMDVGGGMIRRGAPGTYFENLTDERKKRERERARAGVVS